LFCGGWNFKQSMRREEEELEKEKDMLQIAYPDSQRRIEVEDRGVLEMGEVEGSKKKENLGEKRFWRRGPGSAKR